MENTVELPEAADGDAAPNRPKRSRTGCLTCRTRRRKCDEGKPICQNCVTKGLECRYAAAFQILGKNNFTPEVATNVKYTNLRFISADADTSSEDKTTTTGSSKEDHHPAPSPDIPLFSTPQDTVPSRLDDKELRPRTQGSNNSSNDNYQFALHGLLALGSASAGVNTELSFSPVTASGERLDAGTPGSNNARASGSQDQMSLDAFSPQRFNAGNVVEGWQLGNVADNPGFEELPHAQVLELLKCYRYSVAPWVDICDMHQCFGCEVLQLSTDSTAVRYGIMALAEATTQQQIQPDTNNISNIAFLADLTRQRDHNKQGIAIGAVLDILSITRNATANLSLFWLQEEDSAVARGVLDTLIPEISISKLASCAYWFLVRLQLSTALISSFPVRIPLPYLNQDSFTSADHDITFRYANDAVALCVDAAMFCQGDDDKWLQQRYGQNRVEVWKTLIQGFSQWYIHRPQEFQPIIELYSKDGFGSDDEFPTIIFTGGASIVANQLYHTGMLLLLQSKPRFAEQPKSNSPSMSALWHTHRICGTAINNDRRECWDPCLIASLMLAARRATHQSQHTAIINTLENVQRLTGWNVNHHLTNLRNEWQMAEGW